MTLKESVSAQIQKELEKTDIRGFDFCVPCFSIEELRYIYDAVKAYTIDKPIPPTTFHYGNQICRKEKQEIRTNVQLIQNPIKRTNNKSVNRMKNHNLHNI